MDFGGVISLPDGKGAMLCDRGLSADQLLLSLPVAQSRVSKQIKPGGENSWCCVQAGRGLLDQSSPIKHEESLFLLSEVPQVSVAACAVRKKCRTFSCLFSLNKAKKNTEQICKKGKYSSKSWRIFGWEGKKVSEIG